MFRPRTASNFFQLHIFSWKNHFFTYEIIHVVRCTSKINAQLLFFVLDVILGLETARRKVHPSKHDSTLLIINGLNYNIF